jgi:hypothetical protein
MYGSRILSGSYAPATFSSFGGAARPLAANAPQINNVKGKHDVVDN